MVKSCSVWGTSVCHPALPPAALGKAGTRSFWNQNYMSTSGRFRASQSSNDTLARFQRPNSEHNFLMHGPSGDLSLRTYSQGPLDRLSNTINCIDQTSRGRDTYSDRGCSTIVTKVKLAHLIWASSISCQRESVAANYSWHCLLPKSCSLPDRIVPLHHLLLTFQTSPGKPQTLQLIHPGPRLPFGLGLSMCKASSFHCSCRFPSSIWPRTKRGLLSTDLPVISWAISACGCRMLYIPADVVPFTGD